MTGIAPVAEGAWVDNGSPAFGATTREGNLLQAWVNSDSGSSTFDITTDASGWECAASNGAPYYWTSIWYKPDCAAGETAPVFTSGAACWSRLAEFSGAADSPLDTSADGETSGESGWLATFGAPDSVGGELVSASGFWNGSNTGGTISLTDFTDNDGDAITGAALTSLADGSVYSASAYGVAGATGSDAHQVGMQNSAYAANAGVAVTFKPASSAGSAPTITTASLPAGITTETYSATLAGSGGTPPYTWSVPEGSLPDGLTLSDGVISGTPTTAGTSSFTIELTDSASGTATASLSIVVTAAPPVVATLSYPTDTGATYTAPDVDANLSLAGESNLPYVDIDVWAPVTSPQETVTCTVYSVRNWSLVVNVDNPGLGVTCFPDTGAYPISTDWYDYDYLISGWDETMDTVDGLTASACYDNWFSDNDIVGPTGGTVNEVMFHFDLRNRGYGNPDYYATAVPFGGSTINGVVIPLTYWNIAVDSTAVFFNIADSEGNLSSMPVGAVDAKAMFEWCVTEGFLATETPLTAFSMGYEVCDTQSIDRNFRYNNMWWLGGTDASEPAGPGLLMGCCP